MKILPKIEGSCAVIALQYVSNTTEEEALKICLDNNFQFNNRGMFDSEWKRAAKDFGLKIKRTYFTDGSLKQFIKIWPSGIFLVCTHNHLFVVDNGNIIDPIWGKPGLRRTIIDAYEVIIPH